VGAAQGVSAGKGNDLLVDESHAVEYVTEVLVPLLGVGQAAIGGDLREGEREGGREGGVRTSLSTKPIRKQMSRKCSWSCVASGRRPSGVT